MTTALIGASEGDLFARLDRIERLVADLVASRKTKDFYTTSEMAELIGLAPFTVREHARHGRIKAEKRACGRGRAKEWVVPHAELERYRNFGLLPPVKPPGVA